MTGTGPAPRGEPHPGYRPCVGIALFDSAGRVFLGRRVRARDLGPGGEDFAWQMPQGGIDAGEDPLPAALRELWEETGVRSAELIAEAPDWYAYDLPADIAGQSWKGRYRGQTQKWYALRFTGDDSEIDIGAPGGGGHKPEFDAWRWERLERVPDLIVPFKRPVYERVVDAFASLAGA